MRNVRRWVSAEWMCAGLVRCVRWWDQCVARYVYWCWCSSARFVLLLLLLLLASCFSRRREDSVEMQFAKMEKCACSVSAGKTCVEGSLFCRYACAVEWMGRMVSLPTVRKPPQSV